MRRLAAARLLVLLPLLLSGPRPAHGQEAPLELQVRAAFVHQFARFAQWPEGVLHDHVRICVAGQDVFKGELHEMVAGETSNGLPIVVDTILSPEPGCHVLYISDRRAAGTYLRDARAHPVLTIGETPSFLAGGGIIRLFLEGSSLRFEVNLAAAERVGIRLSSRLIQLARRVERAE